MLPLPMFFPVGTRTWNAHMSFQPFELCIFFEEKNNFIYSN